MSIRNYKKIAISFFTGILLICPQPIAAYAAAADTAGGDQAEAEAFVRDYYETLTEEGLADIPEKLDSSTDSRDLHKYIARYKALFEFGFQGYDNIVTTVYPLSDENYQLVLVQYDALFESSDIEFPGSTTELVHKQDDGQWRLSAPDSSFADLHLYDEIVQLTTSDEIISITNEVTLKYNNIITNNPSTVPWLTDMSNEMTILMSQYLQDDFDSFMDTYIKKETSEKEISDTYIVQKGDCLWDIAEKISGDGMRWIELYENNKDMIGDNPDLILTGLPLQL